MPRRYIYLNHWSDQYEVLVDGPLIIRIHKLFSDSGMIREVEFGDLPNNLKDQIITKIDSDYEI